MNVDSVYVCVCVCVYKKIFYLHVDHYYKYVVTSYIKYRRKEVLNKGNMCAHKKENDFLQVT